MPEATREHRRILEAVAAHEPERAREEMQAHLKTVAHVWVPAEQDAEFEALFTSTR
jgi:DNA-binding FadR family transcriptional regulator